MRQQDGKGDKDASKYCGNGSEVGQKTHLQISFFVAT